ncbi:MAG: acetyl-CoA carboxylase biotin carboxylase subunit [Terriglobia bacterium]
MFNKVLVANRGEIAVRIMRTCREMGIQTVAVYSEADRNALHVRYANEAYPIGPAPSVESYLRIDKILAAAKRSGAEAIHPGYGFLSEKPEFARACEAEKLVFIGPSARAMELMGSKTAARRALMDANLPVVPGTDRDLRSFDEARTVAAKIGYPVMLKASAGGGGKGLRRVANAEELESSYRTARSEAQNAFNDPSVYIEKYIERPRHIEIQLFADTHGNVIYLGERECSLQRRHQKLMEESPSPVVDAALRARMGEAAVKIGTLAGYTNAGTVEFLVDANKNFYFLEMNTRLQVEHPVTEAVTGMDLVKEQLRVAAGEPLSVKQDQVHLRGAAIECRIYAEDPENNFFPSPGLIRGLRVPVGFGLRDDSGVYEGWRVPLEYDPMLSKLVAWGNDRPEAIARMRRALDEYDVSGIKTNIRFFRRILDHPDFIKARFDTGWVGRLMQGMPKDQANIDSEATVAVILAAVLETARHPARSALPPSSRNESGWKSAGREAMLNRWR